MIGNGTTLVTAVLTVLSAAFALVHLYMLLEKRRPAIKDKPKVEVGMPLYAAMAVQKAKSENKVQLDFTAQSLDVVDEILIAAHREFEAGNLEDARVRVTAFFYGAYVGEVACRTAGASWDQESMSRPVIDVAFRVQHGKCMPVTWCENRIRNGHADSVAGKFRFFVLDDEGKFAEVRAKLRSKDGWA
ncbi:MAG TPA: hypothetical protein P5081_21155 [Phycisphaerae bacterium]|nr:hypothetical protein [Phycisphaerae bacterium]HRW55391.1 hypothetical protein [Phycisphaerae bacterium]